MRDTVIYVSFMDDLLHNHLFLYHEKQIHESLPSKFKEIVLKSKTTMPRKSESHNIINVNNAKVTMSM